MSKLVTREKKVAFMGCVAESETTYNRMRHFTSLSRSSNPNEYSRKYVDEAGENTDVTGYAPSIAYAFDQYIDDPVHDEIIAISDGERSAMMLFVLLSMSILQSQGRLRETSSQSNVTMQSSRIRTEMTRIHIRIPETLNQNLIKRRLRLRPLTTGLLAKS